MIPDGTPSRTHMGQGCNGKSNILEMLSGKPRSFEEIVLKTEI